MNIDMSQFHQVFFEESFEGLDGMEQCLLRMDPGDVDPEDINLIFRAAHSIKGGSGTFGFNAISDFTHVMETLLGEMRDGQRPFTAGAAAALLASVDVVREMLLATREEREADTQRVSAQLGNLEHMLANPGSEDGLEVTRDQDESPAPPAPQHTGWKIAFRPHRDMLLSGNDPLRIIRELGELGELEVVCDTDALPSLQEYDPECLYLSWDLLLHTPVAREELDELFAWVEDLCDLSIEPLGTDALPVDSETMQADSPGPAQTQPAGPALTLLDPPPERRQSGERRASGERRREKARSPSLGASSIRVDTNKIDSLINMVGELVITQSMLGMLGDDFNMDRLDRLREGLGQLERHTRELQESVMQIRMLPISFSFSRFPRLVHDLSQKLGKQMELRLQGENTEVDKTVIEKIGDPLVHLVRNSVDHGIEDPAERAAAGKPEQGTITLSAEHRGGNILIGIRDDGRGLARERILQRAVAQGLVGADDSLSDKQVYDLIFQPGFSTAEEVSEVSGRGVGMDVVSRNINELGGSIEVDSEPGVGTSISIRLPLTLAILDGQMIRVGGEVYIVPLGSIVESVQLGADRLRHVAGRGEAFRLRDEYLRVIRMHEVFAVERPRATRVEDGIVVVVETAGTRCGLLVDDLLGQQQVVIKSLEPNLERVRGISAATILGDGSVAFILDIAGVMRLAGSEACRVEQDVSLAG